MKKFIVETFYTCTFKTTHTLDELNDKELSKIDNRKDGEVEIIDVKLNNRKTKKLRCLFRALRITPPEWRGCAGAKLAAPVALTD